MNVRLARVGDGEAVRRLSRRVGKRETSDALGAAVDAEGGLLPAVGSSAHVFVAEANGRVVGVAVLHPDMGMVQAVPEAQVDVRKHLARAAVLLEALVVDPGFRRRGLGTELLIAVENACAAQRVQVVSAEVDEKNARAQAFFAQRGFVALGPARTLPLKVGGQVMLMGQHLPGFTRMVKVRSRPRVYTGRW